MLATLFCAAFAGLIGYAVGFAAGDARNERTDPSRRVTWTADRRMIRRDPSHRRGER